MSLLTESMTSWVKNDGTDGGTKEDVIVGVTCDGGVSLFLGSGKIILEEGVTEAGGVLGGWANFPGCVKGIESRSGPLAVQPVIGAENLKIN